MKPIIIYPLNCIKCKFGDTKIWSNYGNSSKEADVLCEHPTHKKKFITQDIKEDQAHTPAHCPLTKYPKNEKEMNRALRVSPRMPAITAALDLQYISLEAQVFLWSDLSERFSKYPYVESEIATYRNQQELDARIKRLRDDVEIEGVSRVDWSFHILLDITRWFGDLGKLDDAMNLTIPIVPQEMLWLCQRILFWYEFEKRSRRHWLAYEDNPLFPVPERAALDWRL